MISLIILNYNGKRLTLDCLRSIRKIVKIPHSTLVVDQASRDGSVKAIREVFPKIEIMQNEENLSYSEANNKAAEYVKKKKNPEPFISFLNNDYVFVQKKTYTDLLKLFDDPKVGLVAPRMFSELRGSFESGGFLDITGVPHMTHFHRRVVELSGSEYCPVFLIRKDVFNKMGGFDERFKPFLYEDADLCYRVRKAGYKTVVNGRVAIFHRTAITTFAYAKEQGIDYYDIDRLNRARFLKKWGGVPFV